MSNNKFESTILSQELSSPHYDEYEETLIAIHICGAVSVEGVYYIKAGARVVDVLEMEDQKHLKILAKPITKHFICYPKVLI